MRVEQGGVCKSIKLLTTMVVTACLCFYILNLAIALNDGFVSLVYRANVCVKSLLPLNGGCKKFKVNAEEIQGEP